MKLILSAIFLFSVLAGAATANAAVDAKATYKNLKATEMSVSYMALTGEPVIGVGTYEKNDGTTICQRSAPVVPNPVYGYSCFKVLRISSADAIWAVLPTEETIVGFADGKGNPLVGSRTTEKADGDLICRQTSAVVPNPVYTVTCYVRQ